jgi:hypothetical protein
MKRLLSLSVLGSVSLFYLGGCAAKSDPRDPGIEYAPQMYHSIPLEPYSQVDYHPYLPQGQHLIEPVAGTVPRGKADYIYPFPNTNEGYEEAGKKLKNPLPKPLKT